MPTLSYTPTYAGWYSGTVTINYSISYDPATNQSTVTWQQSVLNYSGRDGYGTTSSTTLAVSAKDNPSSTGSAGMTTGGNSKMAVNGVNYYGTPGPSVTVQHSAGPGPKTVTVAGDTSILVYPTSTATGRVTASGSGSREDTVYTVPYASSIAAVTSGVSTQGTFALSLTRYSSSYWHKATVSVGGTTLYTSSAFETSLSFTVPRTWFDGYPNTGTLSAAVSVQTYTDASCTTAVGTPATAVLTVTADAGMAPTLDASFVTVAADNTAAPGILGFVEGYSKAKLRLTKSAVTTSNNATVVLYTVTCQGVTQTVNDPGAAEDVTTGTLTGTAAIPITVTVTDSRGLTAGTMISVTPMPYAPPTITNDAVFRCDALGDADENGQYVSVKATGNVSSLNGQNTLTLTAQLAEGGGSYGTAQSLTSGSASVLGYGLDPDLRLNVKITATDALGNSAEIVRTLPTRVWAMKFRADGAGVAFGKPPEYGQKKMELPSDWTLMFGAETWLNRVYPVGSIYLSTVSTNPGTLFGGTWQRIEDTFLLAAGTNYAAGATGGEVPHTSDAEAPGYGLTTSGDFTNRVVVAAGGDVLPPYLAVYMWERVS